ncbi:glycosyltransferase family 2 protein [Cyanobium sp. Cruz-8H5]|uniref:glycosyltransferase family 2 protein n=1 Tax=Cyanobium sp. Cruz-8H5 TaxID=2823712 RepID=UPI0020CC897C|nr:glycosyltransferase family 2 protein [Cyanobium sp. Cruz-8H5]MCP9861486.1 glycosyltransferase family 2 protein [Cyanobium sp. Cruz-8H5]
MPKVSVIIPLYNREGLVGETLDSLLAQTFPDWEAVVVDDHSTDCSLAVAEGYARRDGRIRVYQRSGAVKGAPACRNEGFRRSTGEYVIFMDSDDLLMPQCLEHRVAFIEARPELDFAVWQTMNFRSVPGDLDTAWNVFTDEDDLDRFLRSDAPWQTMGPIWRREVVEGVGGWLESALCWQDWEFHLRVLAKRQNFERVESFDNYYRVSNIGSGSISGARAEPKKFENLVGTALAVTADLIGNGVLSKTRRATLGGLLLWMVLRLDRGDRDGEAVIRECLRKLYDNRLLPLDVYISSIAFRRLGAGPILQKQFHRYLWRRFRSFFEAPGRSKRNTVVSVKSQNAVRVGASLKNL